LHPLRGPGPQTGPGAGRSARVRSPSSHELWFPQATTVPLDFNARSNDPPAEIAMTPLPDPRPLTCTGVAESVGAFPSPSSPDWLLPQASTVPSDFRAREDDPPAATAITPLPGPRFMTGVGADRLSKVPSPS